MKAVEIAKENKGSTVLVLSDVRIGGGRHEADTYAEALKELGCELIKVVREGQETIGQVEYLKKAAGMLAKKRPDVEIILISNFLHFPRVWWLALGMKVSHLSLIHI